MVSQSQFRGHNTFALSTVDNDKYNYRDCHYDYYYQSHLILTTQAWKRTSGDPSGQTWNYRGIILLYNFTTALLYMVSSVTMARIVAMLLNIY